MIRPPGFPGAAFGDANDGDGRNDPAVRRTWQERWGIPADWATMRQVHGAAARRVEAAGDQGEADALFTTRTGIALAAATADCVPIIVAGDGGVAVIHAGWRGAAAGIVPAMLGALQAAGIRPERAALGPAIRACCYEVGPEVAQRFPQGVTSRTTSGATSLDLPAFLREQLRSLNVWDAATCTMCDAGFFSHRESGTPHRQVALGWM